MNDSKQWSDVAYIVAFILGPVIASYFNSRSAKKAAEKVKEDLHDRSNKQDSALRSIQTTVNGRLEAEQRKNTELTALVSSLSRQLQSAGIEPDMSASHKRSTDS